MEYRYVEGLRYDGDDDFRSHDELVLEKFKKILCILHINLCPLLAVFIFYLM